MFAYLKALFGFRATHESITAGLATMVRRLEKHAQDHFTDAVVKEDRAGLLLLEAGKHRDENARALETAKKIGALIS